MVGGIGHMADEGVPDATLWLEAISGTEQSFATLFDRHRTRVFRKAYSRVRSVSDAEDIVAVVFLEAWRNRKRVRIVDGSILPWLLAVTTNVTLNNERSSRRYRRLLAKLPRVEDEPDHATEVVDRLDRDSRAESISAALRRLSQVERVVVDLCIIDELPLSTAAAVLDLPLGTVKSRLHRAKERLRTDLGQPDIPFQQAPTPRAETRDA